MPRSKSLQFLLAASITISAVVMTACNQSSGSTHASVDAAKLPITTRSDQAKQEFLQGRDLAERLLAQESVQHLDKALSLDPEFALAELSRANSSATAKDFFDHLQRAVALEDKASDGERLLIEAAAAGAKGETVKQKDALEKLVAAYPNDERAQFTLANYYFGQQELSSAVEHYRRATEIAPAYSPAYNVLGYAYRQQGDYANAEQAFKKYVNLIPNDPNPYDSYAELLLKMGRFDESQTQYNKALGIDSHFVPSHFGLSAALLYAGKASEAQAELQKMADQARNDGELRTALFGMAVLASDGRHFDQALAAMDKEYAVAAKKNDVVAMSADLQASANILEEIPRLGEARRVVDRSFRLIDASNQAQEIKDNAKLLHHFNLAEISILKNDLAGAKTHADEFRQGAEATRNALQIKQSHELAGRIAFAEKDYDRAIAELEQSNLQDPYNLYRISRAYWAKGDHDQAQDWLKKAANFNCLPQLNYAFIRTKAQKMAGEKKG